MWEHLVAKEAVRLFLVAAHLLQVDPADTSLGEGPQRLHIGLRVGTDGCGADCGVFVDHRSSLFEQVHTRLREIGYTYVTLDLRGYRTGSMNEVLTQAQKSRP